MTQPRPAEEAKLQQGQKVFALEHIVKAGSSARGCNVPVGPSCVSSSEACSACAVVGERPPGLHAWWVQASRGTVPAAKAVERCAPATPMHPTRTQLRPTPTPTLTLPPSGRLFDFAAVPI